MIFNPLYFSESGNSHMLVTNSSKLSNNQYLFSDIVKVIMNTDRVQKKIMETGLDKIAKDQLPEIAGVENDSKQIKFKELSEKDHDKVKTDLADILPPEIAQLIMNNNTLLKNGEVLSYISEEPLEGELENFIKGLIGEDVLNENITKDTGLFLHLEDTKSAVNIELKKVSDPKLAQGKVLVQTLVVPEKSKLISLFKTNGNEVNSSVVSKGNLSLNLPLAQMDLQNTEQDQNPLKPTLSVYSFKNIETQANSLIGNNNDNLNLEFVNSNLIAFSKNSISSKIPLNKINFITNETKNGKVGSEGNTTEASQTNAKDFSVTKITIVKKQNDVVNNLIEKLNAENKKIDSNLRRINFNGKFNSNNNELTLLKSNLKNIPYDQTKNVNIKNVVSEDTNQQARNFNISGVINNNSSEEIVNSNSKSKSINNNNNEIKSNEGTNRNTLEKEISKLSYIKFSSNVNDKVKTGKVEDIINSDKMQNKSKVNSDEVKPEVKNVAGDEKVSKPSIPNELKKVQNDKSNLNEFQIKSSVNDLPSDKNNSTRNISAQEKSNSAQLNSSGEKIDKKELNPEKISVKNESDKISGKIETKQNISQNPDQISQKKESNISNQNNLHKQNVLESKNDKNIQKVDKINDTSQTKNAVPVNENTDNNQLNESKKVTVKVRSEVKSVTNKVDDGNRNIADQSNSNLTNDEGSESEQSLKDSTKSTSNITEKNTVKHDHEINFGHSLKDEITKDIDGLKKNFSANESSNTQKYVKSSEVMKEITKFISKQEKGTLSFDIKPEHLGKMKITLDTVDHNVKATIQVENENAKNLVQRNIQKLQQELSNNGVQLNSITISLGQPKNHRNERHNLNGNSRNNSSYSQEDLEIPEEIKQQKSLGYNTYEYIA